MDEYLERIYARYSEVRPCRVAPKTTGELLGGRERVLRKVFGPWLPCNKDAKILDIGCGYGEFLYFLQQEGYRNAAGIDLNRKQLDVADYLGVRNARYGEGKDSLLRTHEEFDCILAIDLLEHLRREEFVDFLDLVHGALRPAGRFICQVPNLAAFYSPLFYMDFSHETAFTAPSLKQVLEVANFSHVRVYPRGPVIHGAKSAVRFVLWKFISSGLRFIQTVEGGPRHSLDSIYTADILAVADKDQAA